MSQAQVKWGGGEGRDLYCEAGVRWFRATDTLCTGTTDPVRGLRVRICVRSAGVIVQPQDCTKPFAPRLALLVVGSCYGIICRF